MLVDAAVHASGASKKLISPFVSASAAERKKTIDSADKYKKEKQTNKKDRYTGKHFFSEN